MQPNTHEADRFTSRRSNRYKQMLLISILFLFTTPLFVLATGEAAVFTVDSQVYEAGGIAQTMDATPFIKDGRTLIPVRYLAMALGVPEKGILWSPERQEVTLIKETTTIRLTIGRMDYQQNDISTTMDVAPLIKNGRTYLPARYVAEALGYQVDWNPKVRSVLMTANIKSPPQTYTVEIADFNFSPVTLTIKEGDTVIWTNHDSVNHTVTGGVLDSPLFGKGETFTYTFTSAGTYNYICTPHPYMKGTVIVE